MPFVDAAMQYILFAANKVILIIFGFLHIPPVQIDFWENHIMYFSILHFESLYLIEFAKIGRIVG